MPRHAPFRLRIAATVLVGVALAAALTGCSSTVSVPVAGDANNPLCAEVTVSLPDEVAGEKRRWTDAQATGAWGDPTSVILSCGVPPPAPTEEKCITLGGVDWIVDETEAPNYRVTTYGRTPAVQVYVNSQVVSPNDVLDRLGRIVAVLPVDGECTSTETLLPDAP